MKLARHENKIYMAEERGQELYGMDIAAASGGKFGGCMMHLLKNWADFNAWAKNQPTDYSVKLNPVKLQAPITTSRQIFAIGLNYKSHIDEIKMDMGKPDVFTKFASSITDPYGTVKLSGDMVDWEVELVAVIGKGGRNIPRESALSHVAGYMVGQDISDRMIQFAGSAKQFSLGKSFEGYAPIGPWLTTLDEIENPLDLALSCTLNGKTMQESRTSATLSNVDALIEILSSVVELFPGDLIFTGTPGGVGFGREPKVFLKEGDVLESRIESLGAIGQEFIR